MKKHFQNISTIAVLLTGTLAANAQDPNTFPNSGNVGIGTNTPSAKLTVNGTIKFNNLGTGVGNKFYLLGADSAGNLVPAGMASDSAELVEGVLVIPENWHIWGNDISSANYIGTNNNEDFVIKTNSIERGRMSRLGHFQIGTSHAKVTMGSIGNAGLNHGTGYLGFNAARNDVSGMWLLQNNTTHNGGSLIWGNVAGNMYFATMGSTGTSDQTITDSTIYSKIRMTITSDGKVGIRTTAVPSYAALAVKGNIVAEEVLVALHNEWPDYVFEKSYDRLSLKELERFIEENKHLPDVPSAGEIAEQGGIKIGDIQTRQMEKTEELFLYLIDLNKELQQLKADNEAMRLRLEAIEKE